MRRGSRVLVLVLGTLWLATSAGASSIFFLISSSGSDAGDGGFASFDRGSDTPHVRPGNARFGRRNFVWHTDPVPLRNPYVPVIPFPGFDPYNDVSDGLLPPALIGDPQSNQQLFARISSWQSRIRLMLRPLLYANDPLSTLLDGSGSALVWMDRTDQMRFGDSIEGLMPFPGFRPRPAFGVRLEYRLDRFSFEVEDFSGSSLSRSAAPVAVSAVPVPELGTGALLLAGLCALAAGRRLR